MRPALTLLAGLVVGVGLTVLTYQVGDAALDLWTALRRPATAARPAESEAEAKARARKESEAKTRAEGQRPPGAQAAQGGAAAKAPVKSPAPKPPPMNPVDLLERKRELRLDWRQSLTPEARAEVRERRLALSPEERELMRQRKENTRALLEGRAPEPVRAVDPGAPVEPAPPVDEEVEDPYVDDPEAEP